MDKKLDFALAHNWWTPSPKKQGISEHSRIEYLLKYGSFDELIYLFQQRDPEEIRQVFDTIRGDVFHWDEKRRNMIVHLLDLCRNPVPHAAK